ncbi:hypothetical protein D3C78_1943910 [compost metagenome]
MHRSDINLGLSTIYDDRRHVIQVNGPCTEALVLAFGAYNIQGNLLLAILILLHIDPP